MDTQKETEMDSLIEFKRTQLVRLEKDQPIIFVDYKIEVINRPAFNGPHAAIYLN